MVNYSLYILFKFSISITQFWTLDVLLAALFLNIASLFLKPDLVLAFCEAGI